MNRSNIGNTGKVKAVLAGLILSMGFFSSAAMAGVDARLAEAGPSAKAARGNDAAAYYKYGNIRLESGDSSRAVKDFSAAIAFDPYFAEAYFGRGLAYVALGDNRRAIVDMSVAIALKPSFARAYYERSRAYYALGNKSQALRDLNRAVKLDPELASAR